jgi:hypothetical protein
MIRLILIVVVLALSIAFGVSVAIYHFWGWKGMIALPFILLVLIWVAKKIIGLLLKKVALGLFGMKSGALKGATMNVHSITPVSKPAEPNLEDGEDDGDDSGPSDQPTEEDIESAEPEEPKHFYAVEMTITPQNGEADRIWEPGEFILTTEKVSDLEEIDGKEAGSVHKIQVWDGNAFGSDDAGKYPGEQRLKVTFSIQPGTKTAWLQYYNEPIGQLNFPEWRAEARTPQTL